MSCHFRKVHDHRLAMSITQHIRCLICRWTRLRLRLQLKPSQAKSTEQPEAGQVHRTSPSPTETLAILSCKANTSSTSSASSSLSDESSLATWFGFALSKSPSSHSSTTSANPLPPRLPMPQGTPLTHLLFAPARRLLHLLLNRLLHRFNLFGRVTLSVPQDKVRVHLPERMSP